MRKLTLFTTLVFSLSMFSSSSFADWKKVDRGVNGDTIYVDFERIKKHGGYVYWWDLSDLLKPTETGMSSAKVYRQGDCILFRFKILSYVFHKEPMGGEPGKTHNPKNPEWTYPPPASIVETILESVCRYADKIV